MNDKEKLLYDIKQSYKISGYDLYKAVDVWLDNGLNTMDIKKAIKEDCGHVVTAEFVEYLVRKAFFKDSSDPRCLMNASMVEKLGSSKIVKLTPSVKANIVALGNNTFTTRYSSSGVEWSIVFIDNVPHLARKDFKDSDTKYSNKDIDERNLD